jgi:hypothetical protein
MMRSFVIFTHLQVLCGLERAHFQKSGGHLKILGARKGDVKKYTRSVATNIRRHRTKFCRWNCSLIYLGK